MRWKRQDATTPTSCSTCEGWGRTLGGVGRLTFCWGRSEAMTEEEWLACADPKPMLEFLRGKASDRKLRLFATSCCRSVWDFITDADARMAVLVAENYVDGLATSIEVGDASSAIGRK